MEISGAAAATVAAAAAAASKIVVLHHHHRHPHPNPNASSTSSTIVRSDPSRCAPRALVRRARRTRRRSLTDGGGDGPDGAFSGDGDGDDGPFGGGGGGGGRWGSGGGGGWGSGWSGSDWGGSGPPPPSSSDPAFDLVYQMMCWISLSSCTHFALKRTARLIASGREKVVPFVC